MLIAFLLVIIPVIILDIGFGVYFLISRIYAFAIMSAIIAIALTVIAIIVGLRLGRGIEDSDNICNVWISLNGHLPHKPLKGNLVQATSKILRYEYGKQVAGLRQTITIPIAYAPVYKDGRRQIYVTSTGHLIARPFFDTEQDKVSLAFEEIIKELVLDHLGADAIRAIKSHKQNHNLTIIIVLLVIALIAISGLLIGNTFNKSRVNTAVNTGNVTQTQPTIQPIIEGE